MLQEAGRKIQSKREELGLTLEDVHEGTKIRINFLQGIEQGDYSGFPGTVYVRGFIRTYLQFLGAEELWSEFLPMLSEGIERKRPEEQPVIGTCTPPTKGFKPASRFWIFALLVMIVTGSGWYVWYSWEQSGVSLFAPNGDRSSYSDEKTTEEGGRLLSEGRNSAETAELGDSESRSSVAEGTAEQTSAAPKTCFALRLFRLPLLRNLSDLPERLLPHQPRRRGEEREYAGHHCEWRLLGSYPSGTRTVFERTMRSGDTADFKVTQRLNVTFGRGSAVRVSWNGKDMGSPGRGVERIYYDPDGSSGRFE